MKRDSKFLIAVLGILVIIAVVMLVTNSEVDDSSEVALDEDINVKMIQREPAEDNGKVDMAVVNPDFANLDIVFSADLVDVTEGNPVRGTQFDGNASGMFKIGFIGEMFAAEATFENLPDIEGTDFYEGWLVRTEPFDFVSTGVVTKEGDQYVNRYLSEVDLSTYKKYVLTIEPDDGDPRPAEHVVEN
jgi:hypothetical protein